MKFDTIASISTATTGLLISSMPTIFNGIILPIIAGIVVPLLKERVQRVINSRKKKFDIEQPIKFNI